MVKHPYLNFSESTYAYGKAVNKLTNSDIKVIHIPPVFDDDCVVDVGSYSFRYAKITSLFIPKNVLFISWGAFEGCAFLSEVRFEEGSRLEKISGSSFSSCHQLKKIDFQPSVKIIESSFYKVFMHTDLECFSYQGTFDFSNIDMFTNTPMIHVSSSYQFDVFGKVNVTKDDETCNISHKRFYGTPRLCKSPNIRYQCHTNNFISIIILLST